MNRDDIERMAREAKGHPYTNRYTPGETAFAFSIDRLEHFVSLVSTAAYEECAKVCESVMPNPVQNWADAQIVNALRDCATAIRARKDKQ